MSPSLILGPQVCGSLSDGAGATREWLVPDGVGGYAMGTVSGLRTRRYHALLATADRVLTNRHIALASLDPTLVLPSGAHVPLYTHEWASGAIAPHGHQQLEFFELADGLPRWRWRIGDVVLERELAMAHGQSSLGVVHRLISAPGPVRLVVAAMCTWRDSHGERRADGAPLTAEPVADGIVIEDAYRLAGPGWTAAGVWHLDAYAREEAGRGLNPVEDLWHAGSFTATLEIGQTLEVSAWSGELGERPPPPATLVEAARDRARRIVGAAEPADSTAGTLALAADAFVVQTATGPDVVSGYPWFNACLSDAMTSYEGLFLDTGRSADGADLLRARVAATAEAMAAGRINDPTDGPLWLVHAVERHVTRLGDTDLAAQLLDPLIAILRGHVGLGPEPRLGTTGGRARTGKNGKPTSGAKHGNGGRAKKRAGATPVAAQVTPTVPVPPFSAAGLPASGPATLSGRPGELGGASDIEPGAVPTSAGGPPLRLDTADGLVRQDSDRIALTWMNARLDGGPVTPRTGKPVEVNALWINALGALGTLQKRLGRDTTELCSRRDKARASFARRYAAPEGWLCDVVDAPPAIYPLGGGTHHDDPSLRPNQLLAYGLPHPALSTGENTWPIRATGDALLTPLGLRSLSPTEFGYQGGHRGPRIDRDSAYHQGAVWPWLIGPYLDACLAVGLPTDGVLAGLEAHLGEWGLGSISETAEGDAPHAASGCPFSARSVAELNRIRRRL